jgi:hypothetical protein
MHAVVELGLQAVVLFRLMALLVLISKGWDCWLCLVVLLENTYSKVQYMLSQTGPYSVSSPSI